MIKTLNICNHFGAQKSAVMDMGPGGTKAHGPRSCGGAPRPRTQQLLGPDPGPISKKSPVWNPVMKIEISSKNSRNNK